MGQKRIFEIERTMHNEYDMLKGCINRMFITDNQEELPKLRDFAKNYVVHLFELGMERLDRERERGEMNGR